MKRNIVIWLVIAAAAGVFFTTAGCASKVNPDGSPAWTTNPPSTRSTYYTVGYGKLSNMQNSLIRAESAAKDRLARWASTTVRGALTNYFQDSGESGSQTVEMMENISSQIVNISVNGARIEEQWIDPDGGVWVLLSYPVKNLKDAYQRQAEELERKSEAYQVQLLLDYLDIELDGLED
jgi:hypothetical protein